MVDKKRLKVLNLYCGIGGNRKLWTDCEVTAVEMNLEIAAIYQDFFPNDKVVIGDAHQYLLDHYKEFDFIWSSPPCQTHSRARMWGWKNDDRVETKYPDLSLYEEILFLQNYCEAKWVVENVKPYYDPLINPSAILGRHMFWSNFTIWPFKPIEADINRGSVKKYQKLHGMDISKYKIANRKDQILRNCVHPETGQEILNQAFGVKTKVFDQPSLL